MTTSDMQPEVARRLQEHAEARQTREAPPIDQLIAAFMAGAEDSETRRLARQVFAEHREFFDLNGNR